MGFYINNLKDLSKSSTTTTHGVCLQCKTKPITGSRKKFCSIECGQKYHQPPKKRRTNKKVKCNWCSEIFVQKRVHHNITVPKIVITKRYINKEKRSAEQMCPEK